MKIKYILRILPLLLIAVTIGCSKGDVPTTEEAQEYSISLGFMGEITTSDDPLTRALTTSDLIGVQVYQDGTAYAHGLFDNIEDIYLNLHSDHKYKFAATIVKNGKDKVSYYYNSSLNSSSNGYSSPFKAFRKYQEQTNPTMTTTKSAYCSTMLDNEFTYNNQGYQDKLKKGYTSLENGTISSYPEVDRFYGEFDNYTPTENGSVTIDLKRTAFGLKYEVSGITDGTVSVKIENNSRTFFENASITSDYQSEEEIFTFSDVYSAWLYADNYTESITVSASWLRGVGINQDLGSKTVQIKRNAMNIIRIKLGAVNYDGNIGIEVEEETDMDEETVTGTLE